MDTSRRPSTTRVLLALVSFVVAVGGVSLLVNGGPRLRATPPVGLAPTPGVTPIPLDCAPNELELVGAFDECVAPVPYAAEPCSVSGHVLDVTLLLGGGSFTAFLYIEVNGAFAGPGTYDLPPWPHPLGTPHDQPKVAVQQDGTGAFKQLVNGVRVQHYDTDLLWQSVAGVIAVTGRDGRSGTVSAILEESAGHNATEFGAELSVSGPWNCP
jgi:hypothetical protein